MNRIVKLLAVALIACMTLASCSGAEGAEQNTEDNSTVAENEEDTIAYPTPDGKKVVCLDAGHGFRDIGCDSDMMEGTEAQVTMAITLLVKQELEKMGACVILTHDGITHPSAEEIKRAANSAGVEYEEESIIENDIFSAYERAIYAASIAEEEGIDLFLSLHVNSIENHPEISRYEIDYHSGNPYANALGELCSALAERLDNEAVIFEDETEKAFIVTKIGSHPSLLLEMGYSTNAEDCARLNSNVWRESFAKEIADTVMEWISSYEEK